jgi:hypothetical protein
MLIHFSLHEQEFHPYCVVINLFGMELNATK